LLPFWMIYLISDGFYLLIYHVLGYRKKIVRGNLSHSFPEKPTQEIISIEKKFYKNLCDSILETIKLYSISEKELARRVQINHAEIPLKFIQEGHIALALTGHFFNWEYHMLYFTSHFKCPVDVVYHKVSSKFFDDLMMSIRTRFGAHLIERNDFQRDFLKKRNLPRMIVLAADQRPTHADIRYWKSFMNRETAFFEGAEKIAKKFEHPVFYSSVEKPKRGHYVLHFKTIGTPPYNATEVHSITDKFVELCEENIKKQPELYLWSHNRWKHAKK
jgi:Kdo2-lipid IVA lauroyltransferase/acyltransferase